SRLLPSGLCVEGGGSVVIRWSGRQAGGRKADRGGGSAQPSAHPRHPARAARDVDRPPDRLHRARHVGARRPGRGGRAARHGLTTEKSALPSILVVEDEEKMRDLLRRMLERASFTVMTAPHGREALKLFRERPVDLAITDLMMPEMDGFELIRELTAQWPSIRIIAISGADLRLDMARQLGAKAVLKKPVTGAALVTAVEQVLAATA